MAPTKIAYSGINDPKQVREAETSAAVTPGMLVLLSSTGTIAPQSNAATLLPAYVALENTALGGDLDTAYASGDVARYAVPITGDKFYMWLQEDANTTANTTLLVSDTADDGTLKAAGAETGRELKFIALETITGAGGGRVRIKVEAL
jgi:hypothetical protein